MYDFKALHPRAGSPAVEGRHAVMSGFRARDDGLNRYSPSLDGDSVVAYYRRQVATTVRRFASRLRSVPETIVLQRPVSYA